MIEKSKILDAWIMVEHLSEGDISDKDKTVLIFDEPTGNDYYSLIKDKMSGSSVCKGKNSGAAFIFDVFDFNEVLTILRQKYHLNMPDEEIKTGKKFGFVLYFDKGMRFIKDMTFFTASEYIRCKKEVPQETEFREYEEHLKKLLEQLFDESENDPKKFNSAIAVIMKKYNVDPKKCRLRLIGNIDTGAANLHSFFIDDLEAAKNIDTDNLTGYLYGNTEGRVNLDSKNNSANFNPSVFEKILEPNNYPLGRFPGNTEFALSMMQQVAVNLATGCDRKTIRSVNGPPGTGKTTLLKDIFADLIVKQSYDMAKMSERTIVGTADTIYYNNYSIGMLPDNISENSIVVASSNNGAVQNIVIELPVLEGQIDKKFTNELVKADYFRKISNSKVSVEWKKDSSGKSKKELSMQQTDEEEKFWGLFSLEGGKTDNMSNIIAKIEAVNKYFDEEYEPDDNVYEEFLKEYISVKNLRDRKQKTAADYYRNHKPDYDNFTSFKKQVLAMNSSQKRSFEKQIQELTAAVKNINDSIRESNDKLSDYDLQLKTKNDLFRMYDEQIKLFGNDTSEHLSVIDNEFGNGGLSELAESGREEALNEIRQLKEKTELERVRNMKLREKGKEYSEKLTALNNAFAVNETNAKKRLADLEQREKTFGFDKIISSINALDMTCDYDKLQLSNPWFDEEYRTAQSRLFISALKVRKQFLYENRKNIRAALSIWGQQSKYLEKKQVIVAAWGWINLTVPVISSTFASFSRMCKNLGVNTMGHLFVDEAGQAIPQAAVGAIFRSRHVMVVGDPSQIKPVLTVDASVLSMLCRHFGVTEKYLSESASTQTLVDSASRFGFYKEQDKSEESWIGIPLWVHRRCLSPMFTISNQISYNGFMVQGNPKDKKEDFGKTGWFDVCGKSNNKYVEEQGEFLLKKISKMAEKDPDILNKNAKDKIYVISPFSNVAYQLSQKLRKIGFTRFDEHRKPTNIGTIHTFQGKEAPIVFMVLGADSQSKGAALWSVSEPNMMNVAATRAKKEFYVVGDKRLYLGLGSAVASETYRIIAEYKEKYPEYADDDAAPFLKNEEAPIKDTANSYSPLRTANTNAVPQAERQTSEVRNVYQKAPAARPENSVNNTRINAVPYPPPLRTANTNAVPQAERQTSEVRNAYQKAPVARPENSVNNTRINGRVTFVGNGKKNKYAYITGTDGNKYTVTELIYSNTANADEVIMADKMVSFIPKQGTKLMFAEKISPV
ncbi:MAG: ATP-binding protein [Oscillospiraceae bacterium]|nr:ATP-binding protein [Oscillospiraceae bacterium]